jgi:hypothetical protein
VVAPVNAQNNNNNNNNSTEGTASVFKFDHSKDFVIPVTEEFAEHCAEGALSIEVLGHRSAGNNGNGYWPSLCLLKRLSVCLKLLIVEVLPERSPLPPIKLKLDISLYLILAPYSSPGTHFCLLEDRENDCLVNFFRLINHKLFSLLTLF